MLPANWAPGSAICLLCPQAVRNDFLGAYSPAPTAVIRCTWYGGEEAVCSEDPLCPQGLAALAGGHGFGSLLLGPLSSWFLLSVVSDYAPLTSSLSLSP